MTGEQRRAMTVAKHLQRHASLKFGIIGAVYEDTMTGGGSFTIQRNGHTYHVKIVEYI